MIPGQFSFDGAIDGLVDYASTYGATNFAALLKSKVPFTATWELDGESSTNIYSGSCYVVSYSETGGNEEAQTYSVTIKGTGGLNITTS